MLNYGQFLTNRMLQLGSPPIWTDVVISGLKLLISGADIYWFLLSNLTSCQTIVKEEKSLSLTWHDFIYNMSALQPSSGKIHILIFMVLSQSF